MAVTAAGSPYVESSDLVANYPGASLSLANRVDQVMQAPTQNAITTVTYTAALLDAGKTVTLSNASAVTLTIPAQATVAWVANTQLNFLNIGVGTVTIAPAATVTINGTPLTLATSKGGSLVRTASNTWTFIPFSGGVEAANFTNTATDSYSSGGISYKYITFTGSGDLIVDRAGFADILVIAGGGSSGGFTSGQGGGGGGGGVLVGTQVYLSATTHTVTVGAGGAAAPINRAGLSGFASQIGPYSAVGGGGGGASSQGSSQINGLTGGNGGGAGDTGTGGSATLPAGFVGGNALSYSGGGGGGGGNGTNGTDSTGTGTGGIGNFSSITNASVGRAGGGGGSGGATATSGGGASSTAGTINLGGGGGGNGGGGSGVGFAGGSGVVIIRVVV